MSAIVPVFILEMFFQLCGCVLLCYYPFRDKLKRPGRKIATEAAAACAATSAVSCMLLVRFGFDESSNAVALLLILLGYLYYRQTVDAGSRKRLFVFCVAIHAGSYLGGVDLIIYMLADVSRIDVIQDKMYWVVFLTTGSKLVLFLIIGWIMYRFLAPRLRNIDSDNMKGLWCIPLMFALILVFYFTTYFNRGIVNNLFPITFIPLTALSFVMYILLLNMLENVMKNAELEAKNLARERADQLKTELMRTISHETRTPLAVIRGFAELSAEEARTTGLDAGFCENLETIAAEATRMADMMEEMRQLALVKEYAKDRQIVDVVPVIRQITGLYAKFLEQKHTRLTAHIPEMPISVYGNGNELAQVVFNLLRNADTHTDSGSIALTVAMESASVKVTVSDTGTGIDPAFLPHVFERGACGLPGGSGYGLSICRDIINAYDGEIWVESDGHSGTQAIFRLPVSAAEKEERKDDN